MLHIIGLEYENPTKNFEDFDNMFKAIDPQNCTALYIAVLVYDRVILERDPTRYHDVNAWFNGGWYPLRQRQQRHQSEPFSDEDSDSVSDIID